MTIFDDTLSWRGDLPHMQRRGTTYFVTFCTRDREVLAGPERDIVLETTIWGHRQHYWLHALVVMPDHVHHVFTVYEEFALARVMHRIKSVSAHEIGRQVWQREYFDRVMRSDEDVRKKCEYICQNPVRARLVRSVEEYRWIWRSWVEGERSGGEAASAP
ncbi:MAG TPA: transposase [Thermoanaerobaculia bacterium]|nr:transposase [Thermoanaerobaculia bacterium]